MPYYCTVPRCTSMAGKAKNVSFHQFPRDEELAKLWNKILKRGKPYTKYSKVCSLHFKPEDYTITSVGKNKGQWRTLRKDAIPSQNLPSESPTPYHRKQWSTWGPQTPHNVIDPAIQQHVAQAIYMQTMLAMQAAGGAEIPALLQNNGTPTIQDHTLPHSSSEPIKNDPAKSTSYKCTECSKCFKDPDVFILHKRSHMKNEQKQEKENFNTNTLRSNPILANLLKTNTDNIFDNNIVMENLLMTALAANLDYIRNISMIKNERTDCGDTLSPDSDNGFTPDEFTPNNCDGFTPNSADGFTPNSTDGLTPNSTDGKQNNDGYTPIRSDGFTSNSTDGFTPHSTEGFTPNIIDGFNHQNSDRYTSERTDRLIQSAENICKSPDGFTPNSTDVFTPPTLTNDSKCHSNDKTDFDNDLSYNKDTPNCSFSTENQYRINLKYADFKVNDGIRSPDGMSSDRVVSPGGIRSLGGSMSPDGRSPGGMSPDGISSNKRYKSRSELIKSAANCDNELNESYESNNLIIDENL